MFRSRLFLPAIVIFGASAPSGPAAAHAFGARYDLPLPLGFYLVAAGAAVALTFALMAVFARGEKAVDGRRELSIPLPAGAARLARLALGALGLAVLALILAAGLFGAQSPTRNIAPLFVWVLWWVGFALFTALIGNLWPLLDPWRAAAGIAAPLRRFLKARPAPARLGAWPAAVLLLVFVWIEIGGGVGEHPRALAWLVLAYSLFAWGWMALYGAESWRRQGDPFSRVFGYFGRFAPFGARRTAEGRRRLIARLPGAGLLGAHPEGVGGLAFVMLLLSSVSFDGFAETPAWAAALDWVAANQALRAPLVWLQGRGVVLLNALTTLGLFAAPLVMTAVFALTCWLSARLGGGVSTRQTLRAFALSLLPIAIAYHLAHYASYLMLAGQLAIPLASDPFGWGWNLFGTANHTIDLGVVTTKQIWRLSVGAIVAGHVVSVVVGHTEALRLFGDPRRARRSQVPILALMVGFTMLSLWILAQPVVASP